MTARAGGGASGGARGWRRPVLIGLWGGVALLCLLSLVSFVTWRAELREIRAMVAPHIEAGADPVQVMYQTRDFVRDNVGYGRPPSYFLLPVFSFMRPTALQVIRGGGDCGYRSRAFIVIARLYGVRAHKRALYHTNGVPLHAVAEVEIEGQPPYYVDALYNMVHVRDDGSPLSLAELADDRVLRASIAREVAGGNQVAADYPFEYYGFGDVRSLNWDKNAGLKATYRVLATVLGEERVAAMPRPYLSEEPALMVIVLCAGGTVFLLVLIVLVRRTAPDRRGGRRGAGSEPEGPSAEPVLVGPAAGGA